MKKINLILIIVIFIIISCSNENKSESIVKNETVENSKNNKFEENKLCTLNIINDTLQYYIFSIDLFNADTNIIKSIFKKKPEFTIENEKIDDFTTCILHNFKTKNSILKLYRGTNGFYIHSAIIKDNDLKIVNNCYIGMSKKEFCKNFKIEYSNCNVFNLFNEDHTLDIFFIFENEKFIKLEIYELV